MCACCRCWSLLWEHQLTQCVLAVLPAAGSGLPLAQLAVAAAFGGILQRIFDPRLGFLGWRVTLFVTLPACLSPHELSGGHSCNSSS
jgi:hypothetical protein